MTLTGRKKSLKRSFFDFIFQRPVLKHILIRSRHIVVNRFAWILGEAAYGLFVLAT